MLNNTSIQECKGIGSSLSSKLKKINIESIEDLLFYFPRKYQDRKNILKIKDISDNIPVCIFASVVNNKTSYIRKGFSITRVTASDDTGQVNLIWYNQPYLNKIFKSGDHIFIYGKPDIKNGKIQILNPEYEILKDDDIKSALHMGRIVPMYGLTKGVTNKFFRKIINSVLNEASFEEFLPDIIIKGRKFPDISNAVKNIHFPEDLDILKKARLRFIYEELFMLMLALKYRKNIVKKIPRVYKYELNKCDGFFTGLPFKLTGAQNKVCSEILDDFHNNTPMQRIIIGDVGCGKTIVAAFAAYAAVKSGFQAVYMAPTEILAMQHHKNLQNLLSKFGMKVLLLTSGACKNKKEKETIYNKIKNKEADIIVGTHSLIQQAVEYNNLSLVIIDEQHKFGVKQRLTMAEKGENTDLLIMTATPIPRTLAMSLFADMDISVIDEMPKGRGKVNSYFRNFASADKVYDFILNQIAQKKQAFIVYPLIEENDDAKNRHSSTSPSARSGHSSGQVACSLRAVKKEYDKLKDGVFKNINIDFLHGKLDSNSKQIIMEKFKEGKINVLLATTVVEVGIDIPDAAVMVIKNAERFGLAQLHQLRGRIGRGEHESYCILMSDTKNEDTINRLKKFCMEHDGFKIAHLDLETRGTGEFFGFSQHGFPELRIADPLKNVKILEAAKQDAEKFLNDDKFLDKNPVLKRRMKNFFNNDKLVL